MHHDSNRIGKLLGLELLGLSVVIIGTLFGTGVYAAGTTVISAPRIHLGDGTTVENGRIVIEDGIITAVGDDIAIPEGAEQITIDGSVTPGLIDANAEIAPEDRVSTQHFGMPGVSRPDEDGAKEEAARRLVRELFGVPEPERVVPVGLNAPPEKTSTKDWGPEEIDSAIHGGAHEHRDGPDGDGVCEICGGVAVQIPLAVGTAPRGSHAEQSAEIVPHTNVVDGLALNSPDFARLAAEGVTTVYCTPDSSAVIGARGCIVHTAGGALQDRIVQRQSAVHAVIGYDPVWVGDRRNGAISRRRPVPGLYHRRPTSRMGVTWVFRKAFYDSKLRAQGLPASGGADTPSEAASRVLIDVLDRKIPLRIQAREQADIISAMRLADEFQVPFVLEEATEAWAVIDTIAERHLPVVFGPIYDQPERGTVRARGGEGNDSKLTTMAMLVRAGVPTALSAQEQREESGLARQAMFAMRYGLTLEQAISSVTSTPARLLGIDALVGTIAVGKRADLVLWSGAPFAATSRPEVVVAGGQIVFDDRKGEQ